MAAEKIQEVVLEVFDLQPAAIIWDLDLLRPICSGTAAHGRFGREGFSWEPTDRADALKAAAGVVPTADRAVPLPVSEQRVPMAG